MSQPLPDAESRVEMSQNLRLTLQRAGSYAAEQSHRFVTIEHILLALNEDPDAELMLQACSVDQGRLHSDLSGYLGLLDDRVGPGEAAQPVLDPEAARIVNSAVIAAQKSRRSEVNGAIVLAAIIGDGRTSAANMLSAQGLTFQAAIEALQTSQATSPRSAGTESAPLPHMQKPPVTGAEIPPAANQNPGPQAGEGQHPGGARAQSATGRGATTDDVLADARRRVESTREPPQQAAPPQQQPSAPPEEEEPPQSAEIAEEDTDPAPKALQTEDSLARFERRPPPPIAPTPTPPPVAQPAPTPPVPQPAAPEADRHASEAPPVETYPQRNPEPAPPQPNFGAEALRRPPPPSPRPQQPLQPPPRPEPPPRPAAPPRPAPPPPYGQQTTGYAPPPPHTGGGYEPSQLPVPVPQPPQTSTVHLGQLIENIPRRMRVAVSEIVEVRIARAELQNLAKGMRNQHGAQQHDLIITKAMSVRLRAPNGGFFVESASPETQWIEKQLGILSDDFASWRWTVTPQRTGRSRLQLVVSARTVGSDGLAAETALPDQIFDVRVSTNYQVLAGRWAGWIAAAVAGGLFAKFGEQVLEIGQSVLRSSGLGV